MTCSEVVDSSTDDGIIKDVIKKTRTKIRTNRERLDVKK